ncbi:MAG: carbonic anhydrase family protein [Dermatophilus congolensis]|nr:carbonic anhydrase family protein [Dermatophilus congolensis]
MTVRTRYLAASVAAIALAGAGVLSGATQTAAQPAPAVKAAPADGAAKWGYIGDVGPSHWDDLGFPMCGEGKKQSPIDINASRSRGIANPRFAYGTVKLELTDNGHGVNTGPVKGSKPNTVKHGGKTYTFAQFHHHAPSEHQIDGIHYPAEMHFVNQAEDGSLAVFGVMFRGGGKENKAWKPVIDVITQPDGDKKATAKADLNALLPKDRRSFRYEGSLTTPPCSEGVAWTVFTTPVTLSSAQLNEVMEAYQGNARPVQPLNGRSVLFDRTSGR